MMQKEYFGFGSIKNLRDVLGNNHFRNIFFVTGKKSYESCGAKEVVSQLMSRNTFSRFYEFEENPKIEDVERGIHFFRERDYDMVVAIGGGSVIDMAKLINILSPQKGESVEYVRRNKEIEVRGKPLIAIPTTAGSGSEATHFAVVYVDRSKYSVTHEFVLPTYAIVDPQFTMSMPPVITASTGMDALSQATESYWAVSSTDESKKYASEAIKLVLSNLEQAVNSPTENSRLNMARAALLAGQAINISKTTAPHAISYSFTSYFGIPHGHASGLTLGKVFVYNSQATEEDITNPKIKVEDVRDTFGSLCELYGVSTPDEAKQKIENLMHSIGLKTDLVSLGITERKNLELVASKVNLERLGNNPRRMSNKDLMNILQ